MKTDNTESCCGADDQKDHATQHFFENCCCVSSLTTKQRLAYYVSKGSHLINLLFVFTLILIGLRLWRGNWYFLPLSLSNNDTVVVMANSVIEAPNNTARFKAYATAADIDKDRAVALVNEQINQLRTDLLALNIPESDLQTSYLTVYQVFDNDQNSQRVPRPSYWRASQDLNINVQNDISLSERVANLLLRSNLKSFSGPNFDLDASEELTQLGVRKALENARMRAQELARSSNRRLGRVLMVRDNGSDVVLQDRYFSNFSTELSAADTTKTRLDAGQSKLRTELMVTFELR